MASVQDIFGIDSSVSPDGFLNIDFKQVPAADFAVWDGEQTLAAIMLVIYANYFKDNNENTQRAFLERGIVAPVNIDGVDKIEYTFSIKLLGAFNDTAFNPNDI